jgi:hypothetical protein
LKKFAFSRQDDPRPAKYQLYRKPLIEAGVELYEIKPTTGAQLKRRFREPAGSSIGGLHAKTLPSTAALVSSAPTISDLAWLLYGYQAILFWVGLPIAIFLL